MSSKADTLSRLLMKELYCGCLCGIKKPKLPIKEEHKQSKKMTRDNVKDDTVKKLNFNNVV